MGALLATIPASATKPPPSRWGGRVRPDAHHRVPQRDRIHSTTEPVAPASAMAARTE